MNKRNERKVSNTALWKFTLLFLIDIFCCYSTTLKKEITVPPIEFLSELINCQASHFIKRGGVNSSTFIKSFWILLSHLDLCINISNSDQICKVLQPGKEVNDDSLCILSNINKVDNDGNMRLMTYCSLFHSMYKGLGYYTVYIFMSTYWESVSERVSLMYFCISFLPLTFMLIIIITSREKVVKR